MEKIKISKCQNSKSNGEELDKFMLFEWHRILKKGTVGEEIHNTGKWKIYENKLRGIDLEDSKVITYMITSTVFNIEETYQVSSINSLVIEGL